MDNMLYQRIKELCAEAGITISKLESDLGFGNASIKKWERVSSPSINKILEVSKYFGVSVDYLLGKTDIRDTVDTVLGDEDIVSIQRARQRMENSDRKRMMNSLKATFDYAFAEDS